jgi:hypothetical protein
VLDWIEFTPTWFIFTLLDNFHKYSTHKMFTISYNICRTTILHKKLIKCASVISIWILVYEKNYFWLCFSQLDLCLLLLLIWLFTYTIITIKEFVILNVINIIGYVTIIFVRNFHHISDNWWLIFIEKFVSTQCLKGLKQLSFEPIYCWLLLLLLLLLYNTLNHLLSHFIYFSFQKKHWKNHLQNNNNCCIKSHELSLVGRTLHYICRGSEFKLWSSHLSTL